MTIEPSGDLRLDASDPAFREAPHDLLDALRLSNPVSQDSERDRVVIVGAEDAAAVLADRRLSVNPFNARPTAYSRRGRPEEEREILSMVALDDPDHARLRSSVAKAFSGRTVAALRSRIERYAADLLDTIDPDRSVDLISAYADPLPVLTIAALLGIGVENLRRFKQLSIDMRPLPPSERGEEAGRRHQAARIEVDGLFAEAIAERRIAPRDDLIGALVAGQAAGETLSDNDIVSTCRLLLVAGNVTTTDLIGNGIVALLRHPEQLRRLREAQELWPAAVEEILRYDPPVSTWNRQAIDDGQIGGCPVEAGQTISTVLLAANHDPTLHDDPHTFDITRRNNKHFSFGGGAHFCLGAPLARLEAEIALSSLFNRFPRLRLSDEANPQRKAYPPFSGYASLSVYPT